MKIAKTPAAKIIGWKNYALPAVCILVGLWALSRGNVDGAVKGILAGLGIMTLLDAFAKVLSAIELNRHSTDGLRGAIEAMLSEKGER